jgi:hypothetical protein
VATYADNPPNTYYPGQSIRFSANISIFKVPVDPSTLVLMVVDTMGSVSAYPTPTEDAVGEWHQDLTLPTSPAIGLWTYYWTCAGSLPNQNGVSRPRVFVVAPLAS